jgi:hypothetical protein
MSYALRSNKGRPKSKAARSATRQTAAYKKGYNAALRVSTKAVSQANIKKDLFAALRKNHEDMVKGDSSAAKQFRAGVRDAAWDKAAGDSARDASASSRPKRKKASPKRKKSTSTRRASSSRSGGVTKKYRRPTGGYGYMVDGKFASKEAYDEATGGSSRKRKSSTKKRRAAPKKSKASSKKRRASSARSAGKTKKFRKATGGWGYMVDGKFASEAAYKKATNGSSRRKKKAAPKRSKRSAPRRRANPFGAEFLFI